MRQDERGAATLEFAIVFPCQLFIVLWLIQLSLAFGADQVVLYAAYSGARAGLCDRAEEANPLTREQSEEKAAEIATLPITWAPLSHAHDRDAFMSEVNSEAVSQYNRAAAVTSGGPTDPLGADDWQLSVSVAHHYTLLIPGLNAFMSAANGDFVFLGSEPESIGSSGGGGGG